MCACIVSKKTSYYLPKYFFTAVTGKARTRTAMQADGEAAEEEEEEEEVGKVASPKKTRTQQPLAAT